MEIVLKVMTDIMGTPVRLQKGRSVRIRAMSMRVVINPRQRETTILGTSGITHAVAKMLVNIPVSGQSLCVTSFACIHSQLTIVSYGP